MIFKVKNYNNQSPLGYVDLCISKLSAIKYSKDNIISSLKKAKFLSDFDNTENISFISVSKGFVIFKGIGARIRYFLQLEKLEDENLSSFNDKNQFKKIFIRDLRIEDLPF